MEVIIVLWLLGWPLVVLFSIPGSPANDGGSRKTKARKFLASPLWGAVWPLAILYLIVREVYFQVKVAELSVSKLRRGPREETPGQLSITEPIGGELSHVLSNSDAERKETKK